MMAGSKATWAQARFEKLDSLLLNDELELAATEYKQVFAADSNSASGLYYKGRLEKRKGNKDLAKGYYQRCISKDPGYADAYAAMAIIYSLEENYNRALTLINKAIEIDSMQLDYYNARASIYYDQSKYDLALRDFERILEAKTHDPYFLYNYACLLYVTDKNEEALQYFNLADQLSPGDAKIYFDRALTLYYLDREREAVEDLNRAMLYRKKVHVYERPAKSKIYYYKSLCYEALNQPAKQYWYKFCSVISKKKKQN